MVFFNGVNSVNPHIGFNFDSKKNLNNIEKSTKFSNYLQDAYIPSANADSSNNNYAVITNYDLYNKLVNQHGKDINSIAKELVKNNAVNPENINPRSCTELEFQILQESIADGQPKSVKIAAHINAAKTCVFGQFTDGKVGKQSNINPNTQYDWINIIQNFSKMQLDLGNNDFIKNGTYDDVNDYISELLLGKNR